MTQNSPNSTTILDKLRSHNDSRAIDANELNEIIRNIKARIGSPPRLFRNSPFLVEDPLFVFRGNPNHTLHDKLGYKNDALPEAIDILSLGNSQVHSLNAPFNQTWPGILKKKTGIALYNASMGSFSAVQYMLALREIAFTKPKVTLLTFYTGNNVYNCMTTLNHAPQLLKRSFPQFDSTLNSDFNNPDLDLITDKNPQIHIEKFIRATKIGTKGFDIARMSNLTYFLMPTLRANVQDLNNPFVSSGFEVACQAIRKIARIVHKWDGRLILIIMPTKEFILFKRWNDHGDIKLSSTQEIEKLGDTESLILKCLHKFCLDNNIGTIDLTNELTDNIIDPIYNPMDIDGHPSFLGRTLIANSIFHYFETSKW